uniref:Cilia- and flagella-associated protein 69 ARM repeats domain-containing protein n=1 Tax=Cyprinodon variegatus TaxID=28743 RepID=A0A3Q2CQ46_CYPVA
FDLIKVIRLLEDPLTVVKLLRDLTDISQILNICAEKVSDQPQYASVLCEALKLCRFPFLKEKTSDELRYAQDATEFLSNMGTHCTVLFILFLTNSYFTYKSAPPFFVIFSTELQPTSAIYRLQLLERSNLPKTLLLSTAALQNRPSIKLRLLQTLQLLSSSSDTTCTSILGEGGAEMICLHMNEEDQSGQVLICSSEILWNLLESGGRKEAVAQLSSLECVLSLKEALSSAMEIPSQASDLQLRNHLLAIATLIAGNPNCPLVVSPTPLNNNQERCCSAGQLHSQLQSSFVQRNDFELPPQVFREEYVMVNLLQLVKPPKRRPASQIFFGFQEEELQLQALDALSCIAPVMLQDYMSCQGNTRLLLLLDWCVEGQLKTSETSSTFLHTQRCIRILRSVTALEEEAVKQDLCDQGAINQLLGILNLIDAFSGEDDVIAVETMSNIQLILSVLCENDLNRKELFGSEGVEMVVHFLKKGPGKFYSTLGHNKLVISTVESCVVGSCTTEYQFLEKGGASLMLDLLQASPRCIHSIILSTLLDLCNNPNARPQVLSWRDDGGQTAPRVLLQLWRAEEKELGVLRTKHGGIKDPKKPLQTRFQEDSSGLSFPANKPSAAVLETSENLRAKFYLLLYGNAKTAFQNLPTLRVGEVWSEINSELVLEGVKPIGSDERALSSICWTTEDTARRIMEEQSCILKEQEEEEIREEMLFYTEVLTGNSRSSKRPQNLKAEE